MALNQFDLDFVCRVFEWIAILTFAAGVLISLFIGIYSRENIFVLVLSIVSFSFINAMFWLFLSRIGDALDDIRNKIVYSEEETVEAVE